jgi:hypothetical protein
MKKLIYLFIMVMLVSGCSSPAFSGRAKVKLIKNHPDWPSETLECYRQGRLCIGMTKGQVITISVSPNWWSRHEINGDVYESWNYKSGMGYADTIDFKNDRVIGYSHSGKYYSKNGVIDLTVFRKE